MLFFYPATGVPGRDPSIDPAPGWDDIPGAAGCTLESCSFRDLLNDFNSLGMAIYGVSTQPLEEQNEFKLRKQITYTLINDSELLLATSLKIPTFNIGSRIFFKRMTLIIRKGTIEKIFYSISKTDEHVLEVLSWLKLQKRPLDQI